MEPWGWSTIEPDISTQSRLKLALVSTFWFPCIHYHQIWYPQLLDWKDIGERYSFSITCVLRLLLMVTGDSRYFRTGWLCTEWSASSQHFWGYPHWWHSCSVNQQSIFSRKRSWWNSSFWGIDYQLGIRTKWLFSLKEQDHQSELAFTTEATPSWEGSLELSPELYTHRHPHSPLTEHSYMSLLPFEAPIPVPQLTDSLRFGSSLIYSEKPMILQNGLASPFSSFS